MTRAEVRVRPSVRTGLNAKALVAFVVLAYALSWAWALPLTAAGEMVRQGHGWPTHYPSLLGPALAASMVTAVTVGRYGVRDLLGRMLRWRVPLRWWLVAVGPAGYLVLALVGMRLAGQRLPSPGGFGRFSGTPAIGLVGALVLVVLGALGEETGWRGYALPQLQRRFTPLTATTIVAALWYAWHLPLFALIANYRAFGPGDYVGMLLGLFCGAIVLTWLYNRSGSILLVAVWHGLYNLVSGTQAAAGAVAAVVSTLVMAQAVLLVVLEVRAQRSGAPSVLGPA